MKGAVRPARSVPPSFGGGTSDHARSAPIRIRQKNAFAQTLTQKRMSSDQWVFRVLGGQGSRAPGKKPRTSVKGPFLLEKEPCLRACTSFHEWSHDVSRPVRRESEKPQPVASAAVLKMAGETEAQLKAVRLCLS